MKTILCECGHEEIGSTEKDALTKMESHMHNEHPEKSTDIKAMLRAAKKTISDSVMGNAAANDSELARGNYY